MREGLVLSAAHMAAGCAGAEPEQASEEAVLEPVRAFYAAFDDGFTQPADYAIDDWNHINPLGGRRRSKAQTLDEVRAVHGTFLNGVTDTIEAADVRFANEDVAVATVVSRPAPLSCPAKPRLVRIGKSVLSSS